MGSTARDGVELGVDAPGESRATVPGTGLITKACDILDLVAQGEGDSTIADLAHRMGLPKSTVHRIVAALASRGFLRHGERGHNLTLGFHLLDLAHNVWSISDLVAVATIELRRLREMTGETAYLAAPSGATAVTLARCVGAHENSSMSALGSEKPLYCTSQGKAILSRMTPRQAESVIARLNLQRLTPNTICDAEVLRTDLAATRRRGFAIDDEEIYLGTRCVAAPVLDLDGKCTATISLTGPAYRMTLDRIERLGPELVRTAERIRENLPPPPPTEWRNAPGCVARGEATFHSAFPFWSIRDDCLYWADRLAPAVYVMRPGGTPRLLAKMPKPIDALGPAPDRGVDVVCDGDWYRLEPDANRPRLVRSAVGKVSAIRGFREGMRCGAVVVEDETEVGLFDANCEFQPLWKVGAELCDLAATADGECVYGADARRGAIYEFRRNRATPHILARPPRASGEPHGLTVDPDGAVWVAMWDGWSAVRLDSDGEIRQVLGLPAPRPTGLAFGGDGTRSLFVTTARLGLSLEILENASSSGRLLCFDALVGSTP